MDRKQLRNDMKNLYRRLDDIADSNDEDTPEDAKLLRKLSDQKELVDSLQKDSIAYSHAYNRLLELGYQYYHISGQVDTKTLPGVTAQQLVQYYNRIHANAFNLDVQTHVHEFLVEVAPILLQLQHIPDVMATNVQFGNIRNGFQQELAYILKYGFALDLKYYQMRLEPKWLVIKMARHLEADDFKALVGEMDRYSRMRTGQEKKVGYHPTGERVKKKKKKPQTREEVKAAKERAAAKAKQQREQAKKQETRLDVRQKKNGQLVVHLPSVAQMKAREAQNSRSPQTSVTGQQTKAKIG